MLFREKAARAGVSAQLASFLLYSLSPFHPNPDILENKDLLTELTKQYKVRNPLLVFENINLESTQRCWRLGRTRLVFNAFFAQQLRPAQRLQSKSCHH